ncbi:MAG: MBL fold metallo-hydrolase [Candidatus Sumerlaeota bacterium]|nr:MBL fold metallo-hydrolase [Candidatus Sumerlaeota bacterium]
MRAGSVKADQPGDRFSIHFLSSGSSGNCTLVRDGPDNFLIDFGVGPQKFVALLRAEGVDVEYWRERAARGAHPSGTHAPRLTAALMTHTHGDHVTPALLRLLHDNHVMLWTHAEHSFQLDGDKFYGAMIGRGMVNHYDAGEFQLTPSTRVRPLRLPHDSHPTHGFVLSRSLAGGARIKVGYAADLGHFPKPLAGALSNCDLLALEFNHDENMERTSLRPSYLKNRVLGTHGHLSNDQAADALREILRHSTSRFPRCIALLHLSRDCNRAELAREAAARVLRECGAQTRIIVTRQRECAGSVDLLAGAAPPPRMQKKQPRELYYAMDDFFME